MVQQYVYKQIDIDRHLLHVRSLKNEAVIDRLNVMR